MSALGGGLGQSMFFYLSKILIPLESPGDLLLSALVIGVILSWPVRTRTIGLAIATIAALAFLSIAVLPVSDWLIRPLEDRFPRPPVLPGHVDGLIVLGGAVEPITSAERKLPTLNVDAERMTEFVRLAKIYPQARLAFSGGSGLLNVFPNPTEAGVAGLFFKEQGLDIGRITFEDRSRNTYENVLFSKALLKPRGNETWLLIQSARNVPRSMGIFRQLGWSVIPIPVAYETGRGKDFDLGYDFTGHMLALELGAHEWLGLLAYRLTGKTDALFPSPQKR